MLLDRQDLLQSTFVQSVLKRPAMGTRINVSTCRCRSTAVSILQTLRRALRSTGASAALMGAI